MPEVNSAVLLLAHLAVTAIYFLVNCRFMPKLRALSESMLVLFLPVAGLAILLSFKLLCRIFHLARTVRPDEEEEQDHFFMDNMKYDENIVPLKDTFLMDDALRKRGFFTETIKQNVVSNQSILQMAMHDSDREVAYYAVSMLTTRMEQLDNRLFRMESDLSEKEDTEPVAALEEYADVLKEYLQQKEFVDHVTLAQKQAMYMGVLDRLTSLRPERKDYYLEEVRQLIEGGDLQGAEAVCANFAQRFPRDEDAYLLYIRVYHAMNRPDKMQETIAALKASPIRLSKDALSLIRFWDRNAPHG